MEERSYIAIDLKSFYASVECASRGLDPLRTNLVVADETRTDKTICLAVSPSLKAYGIPGRARLFEAKQRIKEVNAERKKAYGGELRKGVFDDTVIKGDPSLALDFITATPRMATYMKVSSQIYGIYLKYIAPEDIHVYSVDEVFIDVTHYLKSYKMTAHELAVTMIRDVLRNTGITATAGVGTNLYLAKVAMDIVAKHMPADADGVRIAELDEVSYREKLWDHRPLTDFWRVGRGYQKKLEDNGMFTMGDIARCSMGKERDWHSEELLYVLFGVNAELLIDHAWGWEPVTIADIKAYRPESKSISQGQVLHMPYTAEKARMIVREMTDQLSFQLVEKGLVAGKVVLTVGYDTENMAKAKALDRHGGGAVRDYYGRYVPKPAHGTETLSEPVSSSSVLSEAASRLYDRIIDGKMTVRRIYVVFEDLSEEGASKETDAFEQLDLFTGYEKEDERKKAEREMLEKEKRRQEAMLGIRKMYGSNAILRGTDLTEDSTVIERNGQIGGHKA